MKFWAVLALAACVAALPLEGASLHKREEGLTHIGFRVISQSVAEELEAHHNIAQMSKNVGGTQLGYGIYLTPGFKEYTPEDPNKPDPVLYDCAALMDSTEWNDLNKAWMNQWYNWGGEDDKCQWRRLWSSQKRSGEDRAKFMPLVKKDFTIENTVRFSEIVSHEDVEQMVIPNEIVARGTLHLIDCSRRAPEGQTTRFKRAIWDTAKLPGRYMGQYEKPKVEK